MSTMWFIRSRIPRPRTATEGPSMPAILFQRLFSPRPRHALRRLQSSSTSPPKSPNPKPPPSQPNSTSTSTSSVPPNATPQSRLNRLLNTTHFLLPSGLLRRTASQFRAAPLSHITAFLILHELTAIVPLVGLTGLFYYFDIVPTSYVFGPWAGYAEEGVRRFGAYVRRKGWGRMGADGDFGEEILERELEGEVEEQRRRRMSGGEDQAKGRRSWRGKDTSSGEGDVVMIQEGIGSEGGERSKSWFGWIKGDQGKGPLDGNFSRNAPPSPKSNLADQSDKTNLSDTASEDEQRREGKIAQALQKAKDRAATGQKGYKLGIQIAASYAIVKVLIAPRLAISAYFTPAFARALVWARKSIWR